MPAELFADLPIDQYHARTDVLSKSMLGVLADCPARFKHQYLDGNQRQETASMRLGTAVHLHTLQPELFEAHYYILPDGMVRNPKHAAYQEEMQKAGERICLRPSEYVQVCDMAAALKSNRKAMALLTPHGKVEASIFFEHQGIPCRCRPDYLSDDGLVVDVKTSAAAHPQRFARTAWDLHYDVSVALTNFGYKALTGSDLKEYIFLVIETEPPYVVECYSTFGKPALDDGTIQPSYRTIGEYRLQRLLETYARCKRSNEWPSYSRKIEPLTVPSWELRQLGIGD